MVDSEPSTPPAPLRKVFLMIDTQVNMLDTRMGVPAAEAVGANIGLSLQPICHPYFYLFIADI